MSANRSAVLHIVPDEISVPNLETRRRTSALSKVIGQINRLEETERDIIALLPFISDEEVIETRNSAKLLTATGWKIEIACDAEIWDRTEANLTKSGVKDVDEKGIKAAVNKRAQDIGCGASTIYANRQLYRQFQPALSTQNGLDEKGFYQAALAADDPDAALESFAKEKLDNPHFRVSDAWRIVKAPPEGPREDETKVLQTPEAQEWLTGLHASLLTHMPTVPANASFLKLMVQAMAGVALQQSERTVEGDCRNIMNAIEETGGLSGDDLYDWMIEHFYFMSEEQLESRLLVMEANKQIIKDNAGSEGKQTKRRGKLPDFYVPFYVKRKKQERCKKCDEWHRDPSDCMEE